MTSMHNRKYVASLLIFSMITMASFAQPAYAGAWGEALLATQVKQVMEEISKQLNDLLTSTLKTVAILSVIRQINQAIGAKGTFITSWEDYLFAQPKDEALVYANNLITQTTLGQAGGYFLGEGEAAATGTATDRLVSFSESYVQQYIDGGVAPVTLTDYVQGPTVNVDTNKVSVFGGDPNNPNFTSFTSLYFSPSNTAAGLASSVAYKANEKEEELRTAELAKQTGAGYETPDNVSPGAIADLVAARNESSLTRALNAGNIEEVSSAMAQIFVADALEGAAANIFNQGESTEAKVKDYINQLSPGGDYSKIY
jgi:hypothetical protein